MKESEYIKIYADYRSSVDRKLNAFLAEEMRTERRSYSSRSIPLSLYSQTNYIMSGKGKRIRPVMLILSCEAFGGNWKKSLDAAVAVEILHNFTLVHDDIMDNADTRRGKQTIHKKWSVSAAILVGDELIGLSYRSLLKTNSKRLNEIVRVFTEGVIEVCEGQALDKEFETDSNITMNDYMVMIRKKTAELIRVSSVIGAVIADAGKNEISIINNYSRYIGLAFQIQDDLFDIIANEKELGKKIGSDIVEKKKTYLYLKALELLPEADKKKFISLYNVDVKTQGSIEKIIGYYNDLCVIESARNEIKTLTGKANRYITRIKNSESREKLRHFSNMLLNRSF